MSGIPIGRSPMEIRPLGGWRKADVLFFTYNNLYMQILYMIIITKFKILNSHILFLVRTNDNRGRRD